jgi:hypothetical protein
MALMDHMFWAGPRANRAGMREYSGMVPLSVGGAIAGSDTPFFDVSKIGVGLYLVKLINAKGEEVIAKRLVGPDVYPTDKAILWDISDLADPSGTIVGPTGSFSRFHIQFFRSLTVGANTTYVNSEVADAVTLFINFTVKHSSA